MPLIPSIDNGNGDIKKATVDALGQAIAVRSARGNKSTPSYLAKTSSGQLLFGEDAKEHGFVFPSEVAHDWKMHLGDPTKRYFNGTASAVDVCTLSIKESVRLIEKQTGDKISKVVATVPANFADAQRQGLLDAFKQAGVEVAQLITEPAGAAYAYCYQDRAGDGRESVIACIDFGHGTLDVSFVRVKEGVATPISTEGVPQLGGRDFTKVVQRILLEKVSKEIGKTITLDKLAGDQAAELWGKAENAKHSLSAQPSTKVALNCGGKSRLIEVTKAEFEAACAPFVKQMKECMDRALKAAGVTWTQLEKLVLAGGPFHSPWLQEEVAVHTGLVPAVQIDPTNVVSFGAALHGFALARKEGGVGFLPDRPILQEATAHDVGVGVIDETSGSREPRCAVIVPKNTPIPHTAPPFLYRLERPSQTEVFIEILQGSEGAPASKCARIGTIHLKGLPVEKQRTERIEITFKFDNNTLVTVTARDTISGISHSVGVTLGK